MKNLFTLQARTFLLLLIALCPLSAWGDVWQDPETKVNYEYTPGEAEACVKAGESIDSAGSPDATGDIAILPKITVNGTEYYVTSIGDLAFENCSLASITIPGGVTSIGNLAFEGCSSLTSVIIPSSVTIIGIGAFGDCCSLTSANLYEGLTNICEDAFWGCCSLTSITIPQSVTSIGEGAFAGCSSLTSISVAEGNPKYDSRNGCNAIIYSENYWTDRLLAGCQNTIIPEGVKYIDNYAFYGCSSLTSITIPERVWGIGHDSFKGCSGLASIVFPESLSNIGDDAFRNCTSLTSIIIPKGVYWINYGAFSGCSSLTSIHVVEENQKFDSRNGCNAIIETESNTLIQGCQNTIIPSSVTSIGGGAFSGCSGLTSITIPPSVKLIDQHAFNGCSGLISISISEGLTDIGIYAFLSCSGLTSFTIPASVINIGDFAFGGCSGLTSISIPASVTSIGKGVFENCSGLTSISVAEGNTKYDSRNGCNAIIETERKTLVAGCQNSLIPTDVTSISFRAFLGCKDLTSVYIPESVTSIETYAFADCSSLTSITIPENVMNLDYGAFYGCSSLSSVTSYIEEPFSIHSSVFSEIAPNAVLYVPVGTIEKYMAAGGWCDHFSAVKEIPVDEVTIDMYDNVVKTYSSGQDLDFSEVRGLQAYAITGFDAEKMVAVATPVKTAPAGTGLILIAKPAAAASGLLQKAASAGGYTVPVNGDAETVSGNLLKAVMRSTELEAVGMDDNGDAVRNFVLADSSESFCFQAAAGVTLSAGEAYLQIPVGMLPNQDMQVLGIDFDRNSDAVGELRKSLDISDVYDLSGRRQTAMRKGVHIVRMGDGSVRKVLRQ